MEWRARSPGQPLRGDNVARKAKTDEGRISLYSVKIAPNLDIIRAMAQTGISQVKMREILGVSRNTWERARAKEPAFKEALSPPKMAPQKFDRAEDVRQLEEDMKKLAHGFTRRQIRFINTRDGIEEVEEEVYYPPNFQAIRFLLMNWGGYMSEPAAQAQREKEFDHKKAMDEKNNW